MEGLSSDGDQERLNYFMPTEEWTDWLQNMENQLTHSQDSPAKNNLRSRILTSDTFGSENVARISGSAEDET